MAMSGVAMDPACMDAFAHVKADQSKYCIFGISKDHKRIEVEHEQKFNKKPDPEVFKEFLTHFPDNGCRYALYNCTMQLMGSDGFPARRDRIVFISWAPDNASIKQKMLAASSKDAIVKNFEGVGLKWHWDDTDEMQATKWIEHLNAFPNLKMIGQICEFEGKSKEDWGDE